MKTTPFNWFNRHYHDLILSNVSSRQEQRIGAKMAFASQKHGQNTKKASFMSQAV
jgi:hypothetical protein